MLFQESKPIINRKTTAIKKKGLAPIEIECSNPHSIPVLGDFLNKVQKKFNIEKNAKNEVYSFFIQMELLDQFEDFVRHEDGVNHHAACIDMLRYDI